MVRRVCCGVMNDPDKNPSQPNPSAGGGDKTEEFVRLFAAHHNRLLAYILAMMHDRADAEEVFQETSLVLWREFDHFPHWRAVHAVGVCDCV